jgi:hypothetical protein
VENRSLHMYAIGTLAVADRNTEIMISIE